MRHEECGLGPRGGLGLELGIGLGLGLRVRLGGGGIAHLVADVDISVDYPRVSEPGEA